MHQSYLYFKQQPSKRISSLLFLQMFRVTPFYDADTRWINDQEDVVEGKDYRLCLPETMSVKTKEKRVMYTDFRIVEVNFNVVRTFARGIYRSMTYQDREALPYVRYAAWINRVFDACNLAKKYLKEEVTPSWLLDDNVAHLAEAIYKDRDWVSMPFLADAMMDAGCLDKDLLAYCKGRERCVNCPEYPGHVKRTDGVVGWAKCFPCRGTGYKVVETPGFARTCGLLSTIRKAWRRHRKGKHR